MQLRKEELRRRLWHVCGGIIYLLTKLWAEDGTRYTKTDGEEEEGITLGGGGANIEEG